MTSAFELATGNWTLLLPAALGHTRDIAPQGKLTETQTAEGELAKKGSRPAAAAATVAMPYFELQMLLLARDFGGRCHGISP
ncbi:MAG TPA: hypothetical protein VNJ02_06155 [Vicinamibacterales bacterium]|nr:hypothetical protein [Vicinamibacterales bacterium]